GIIGGMIGETTLAMLYVPLLFYLFDRMGERFAEKKKKKAPNQPAPAVSQDSPDALVVKQEGN
ncbi:MAG: hypothetical protein RBT16_14720, partial [Desulfococcus multivorans]|nr:hypothetical protein [Desulfococcus multivorans]